MPNPRPSAYVKKGRNVPKKVVSDEIAKDILKRHLQGVENQELCEMFNLSPYLVRRTIKLEKLKLVNIV